MYFQGMVTYPLSGQRLAGGGGRHGGMRVVCLLLSVPLGLLREVTRARIYLQCHMSVFTRGFVVQGTKHSL